MREARIFDDAVKDQRRFDELYWRVLRQERKPASKPVRRVQGMGLYPALAPFGNDVFQMPEPEEPGLAAEGKAEAIGAFRQPVIEQTSLEWHTTFIAHRAVQQLRNEMTHGRHAVPTKPAGRVTYFNHLIKDWGFSREDAARMLGLQGSLASGVFLDGRVPLPPGDVSERLAIVAAIGVSLESLYEEDDVIKKWLDQRRSELSDKTPRELLAGGTLQGLFKVSQLVRYEAQ